MKRALCVCLLFIAMACSPVYARMYQWLDPDTGTTQLSGKPPAWYRSGRAGPATIVLDKGKVIDDTGLQVSEEQERALRREAFIKAEENAEIVRQQLLRSQQLENRLTKKSELAAEPAEEMAEDIMEADLPELSAEDQPVEEATTKEELQALIEKWEQQKVEQALKLLETIDP